MSTDISFVVGGEAGQGVQSVGFLLAKAFARGGYHIFADQDYESRIRGGHSFFRIRLSDSPVGAIAEPIDLLIALNKETIDLHRQELADSGVAIFDNEKAKDVVGSKMLGVPLDRIAQDEAGSRVMANTVALGAALGLVQYDFDILKAVLIEHFGSDEMGEKNLRAARAGYDYAREMHTNNGGFRIAPIGGEKRMLLTGNEAIALGALASGCKFMAAYPMTPATSILEYVAAKSGDMDLVVVQPEDEISAINMIIGASYAGVRSMTATSGGGFCLMVEGLGLAGMIETPIVVINSQRPGPAIGLPTRTEQGDLEFVIHASHGEFPRAVLAPGTVSDAFWLTVKAFNLADKYQTPVVLITDHHLASSYSTVERFDLEKIIVDRGLLVSDRETFDAAPYQRYQLTSSGVSPRAFPGREGVVVVADSDEHDEAGHLIEGAEIRTRMMQKRMQKLLGLRAEIVAPMVRGPGKADVMLIGWGSTAGAIEAACRLLQEDGISSSWLYLSELWPFPGKAVAAVLGDAGKTYVVENNVTGQLAHLIRAETGNKVSGSILKFDGRPFTPAYIARQVRKEISEHGNNS